MAHSINIVCGVVYLGDVMIVVSPHEELKHGMLHNPKPRYAEKSAATF
jgi:hypothetical protein